LKRKINLFRSEDEVVPRLMWKNKFPPRTGPKREGVGGGGAGRCELAGMGLGWGETTMPFTVRRVFCGRVEPPLTGHTKGGGGGPVSRWKLWLSEKERRNKERAVK